MVQYMNAFYALDDIKKRTRRYFNKIDGITDEQDKEEGEPQIVNLDDQYIFKHFYQNKTTLIK